MNIALILRRMKIRVGKPDPQPAAPPAPAAPPTDSELLDWAENNGASILCSGPGQWQVTAACDGGMLFHGHGVTPREALINARRNYTGYAL